MNNNGHPNPICSQTQQFSLQLRLQCMPIDGNDALNQKLETESAGRASEKSRLV